MEQTLRFIVSKPGIRLDRYIPLEYKELSRSQAQKLVAAGLVTVNGHTAKPSLKLDVGDEVHITIPPTTPTTLTPEPIPLNIVYEDSNLLVIDKPAGIAVHPGPGHPSHTLVNAILNHCPELAAIDSTPRPGIVHRLDKDTSGLMLVAKNNATKLNLIEQLKKRSIVKRYLVLVKGHLSPEQGAIEAPIGRDPYNRKRMAVVSTGREAFTSYRVIEYLNGYTLIGATINTGRTHQIRVHLSAIGYPVVGDSTYGGKVPFLNRQFVHAHYIGLRLSDSSQFKEFSSPLAPDLQQALEHIKLGKKHVSKQRRKQ